MHSYKHTHGVTFLSRGSEVATISKTRGRQLPDLLYTPPDDEENVLWIRGETRSSMTVQIPELLLKSGRSKTSSVHVRLITCLFYSILEDCRVVSTSLFLASYSLCSYKIEGLSIWMGLLTSNNNIWLLDFQQEYRRMHSGKKCVFEFVIFELIFILILWKIHLCY